VPLPLAVALVQVGSAIIMMGEYGKCIISAGVFCCSHWERLFKLTLRPA
jgi:hypothetical protein